MSFIAQKLCNDIVDPILKPPTNENRKSCFSEKSVNKSSNLRNNAKPKQNLQTEKKKTTKHEAPRITSPPRLKIWEKQTKKALVNSAINTLFTGPLTCDNNCNTLIHKRDSQLPCKCYITKGSSKEIQTISRNNYSIFNESCTQCVETVSCGTQFIDNINGILKSGCHVSKSKTGLKMKDGESYKTRKKITKNLAINHEDYKIHIKKSVISKPSTVRFINAKYWALSNYPMRGPDF